MDTLITVISSLCSLVVLLAIAGGALFWYQKYYLPAMKAAAGDAQGEAAAISAATGYEPIGPQRPAGEVYGAIHLGRTVEGLAIHFEQETRQTSGGYSMSSTWWAECPTGPGLHIADARLTGLAAGVKNAMTNMERTFTPRFPNELVIENPALAARVKAWGQDPLGLLQRADFTQALLALPEVDLLCDQGRIALADPMMKVLSPSGAMALATMPSEQRVQTMIAGHDRVAHLLTLTAACFTGRG